MKKSIEDTVQNGRIETKRTLRNGVFDFVAIVIVMALALASLDVFDLVDIGDTNAGDFIISWVPYFLATILLTLDLYKKGVFIGKSTDKFKSIVSSYSDIVNGLSGEQIKGLAPFCEQYNDDALIALRTSILKEEGIAYDIFDKEFIKDEITYPPLKTWTRSQLLKGKYTRQQIKTIRAAKRATVRGINVNILLSSINIADPTDIGKGEEELQKRALASSVVTYLVTTALMSLIVIKDISTWGWASLIIVVFKVIYMFARSFMSYFLGYDDITVSVSNHITRKTDILKTYINYKPTIANDVEENSSLEVINNV